MINLENGSDFGKIITFEDVKILNLEQSTWQYD